MKPTYEELAGKVSRQRHELRVKDETLHRKNILLDALGYVWCSGGCESGMYRHTDKMLTEEHLKAVERNTARLRAWYDNYVFKAAYTTHVEVLEDRLNELTDEITALGRERDMALMAHSRQEAFVEARQRVQDQLDKEV